MTVQSLRRTSLYPQHVALGAKLVAFAGWEMPLQYSGIVEEHDAVRGAAGLFDVSHMGELRLRGRHSAQVVDRLVTNDVKRLADGQALYTCACNERGMILDDLIVYRRAREDWLVVCNSSNREKIRVHFVQAAKDRCEVYDQSDDTALLALQGPRAFDVLARVAGDGSGLAALGSFHFRDATLAGIACTGARTGYTGEDGVELFCAWGDAPRLWSALLESGGDLGLRPAGLAARDTLRLEARLSLYGSDIDESTHPFEAGLGWVVRLDKGDFMGRAALAELRSQPLRRKLVGFEMVGRGIGRHGYPLRDSRGVEVGVCTSGSPGPTVGKNIGLGYLPAEMSRVGTHFFVDCRGKNIDAVVVSTPFYKRPRSGASS